MRGDVGATGPRAVQVAVCGPGRSTPEQDRIARRVGELLAERGAVLLCGGGGGVMAAAAAGARSRGGLAVGILPGADHSGYPVAEVDVSIATNLGEARNAVIISSAHAVIAVGGSWGTLSEVALAMRRGGIPVVTVGGWRIVDHDGGPVPGPIVAEDAERAVTLALAGCARK